MLAELECEGRVLCNSVTFYKRRFIYFYTYIISDYLGVVCWFMSSIHIK
jgi:hypothetical protein